MYCFSKKSIPFFPFNHKISIKHLFFLSTNLDLKDCRAFYLFCFFLFFLLFTIFIIYLKLESGHFIWNMHSKSVPPGDCSHAFLVSLFFIVIFFSVFLLLPSLSLWPQTGATWGEITRKSYQKKEHKFI